MPHLPATLGLALVLMTALWPVSLWLKDASIVDILWAPGFVLLGWAVILADHGTGAAGWIAVGLVTAWAVRLGTHIFVRRRHHGQEDHRYTTIRRKFGPRFPLASLFVVFWLQAVLLWIISWPLQAAVAAREITPVAMIGWIMTLAGIVTEGLADAQLAAFRAAPDSAGRVLDTGLWRWSRHPNYFGDFLIWWGFFLAAIGGGGPWWTVVSPLLMTALLMHFSGAGLMEDTIGDRRPGYKAYVARTSRFFPWPPRAGDRT
jgi:steroid 5-alpha reductase family enzyme